MIYDMQAELAVVIPAKKYSSATEYSVSKNMAFCVSFSTGFANNVNGWSMKDNLTRCVRDL